MLDKKLLDILACPKCKGDLEHKVNKEKKKESLICHKCKLKYKVDDGIPIMLIDEAKKVK